jgi:hypothetical protein
VGETGIEEEEEEEEEEKEEEEEDRKDAENSLVVSHCKSRATVDTTSEVFQIQTEADFY